MGEYSMKTGKIAENIVKNMLEEVGFKVIRYGYEHTVPELAEFNSSLSGVASDYIRHQPDFIVLNKQKETFFVEVKYRRQGIIESNNMFNYPASYVVFLTQDGIYAQKLSEIHHQQRNFEPISQVYPFKVIRQDIIDKYEKIIKRRLGDENIIGQFIEKTAEMITGKLFNNRRTPPTVVGLPQNNPYNKGFFWKIIRVKTRHGWQTRRIKQYLSPKRHNWRKHR